ncbi:MAG: hypothetical protein M3O70_08220 [Actinomycetota bacterium]|nr:hypothetical protein [Actinomycetota bacterium]
MGAPRLNWPPIILRAAEVVRSYDTGVTLRQCFYRLVAEGLLPNTQNYYRGLSKRTAEARRQGTFPDFVDTTRHIHRPYWYRDVPEALSELARDYRRDRTEGQEATVCLGVEKRGIVAQLNSWFGDLGVPVLELGGYASQTYVDDVRRDVDMYARPAVLLYAGDHDPSGAADVEGSIGSDFLARTGCWAKVVRVALTVQQIDAHGLPPQMGKERDPRAAAFMARYGDLVQVELDALPPDTLQGLFADAIADFWNDDAYMYAMEREDGERRRLRALADEHQEDGR